MPEKHLKHEKAIAIALIAFLLLSFDPSLIYGQTLSTNSGQAADTGSQTQPVLQDDLEKKRADLEAQIAKLKQEIEDYKAGINQKEGTKKNLTKDVNALQAKINALKLEIQTTELEIERISGEIKTTEQKIKENEDQLAKQKVFLTELMRSVYVSQDKTLIEVLVQYDHLSDFTGEFRKLETLNNNVKSTIEDIRVVKSNLEQNKTQLEGQQEEKSSLLALIENQKQEAAVNKSVKETVLKDTIKEQKDLKNKLSAGEKLLPAMIAQLKSLQLFGKPINFDDAKSAALFASKATGVRPAFLLGILKVESNLGSNVGKGTYTVDMHPNQRPTFINITKELGLVAEAMPVSKKPKSYSGWGGAMGPAQMMPTTWMGYRDRVANITGHNPPSPWNLTDAMTAMALYVSNTPGVTARNPDAEYEAAARYFAGSNWKKFTWYARNTGGTGVMDWAERYEQLLGG